jgi:hypothetical protein
MTDMCVYLLQLAQAWLYAHDGDNWREELATAKARDDL